MDDIVHNTYHTLIILTARDVIGKKIGIHLREVYSHVCKDLVGSSRLIVEAIDAPLDTERTLRMFLNTQLSLSPNWRF
jgi:hypothetical protein